MSTASSILSRDTPHWSRVCVHALLVLGVVAMMNMLGASSGTMDLSSPPETVMMTHGQMTAPLAEVADSGHHVASAVPAPDSGTTLADCCGLVMLCVVMIAGIGAFVLAGRPSGGRMMWQVPRPHTFSLGCAVAPFFSSTPLQRTAALRL